MRTVWGRSHSAFRGQLLQNSVIFAEERCEAAIFKVFSDNTRECERLSVRVRRLWGQLLQNFVTFYIDKKGIYIDKKRNS